MIRIMEDKQLEQLSEYKNILTLFTTLELIYWSDFCADFQLLLRDGTPSCPAVKVIILTVFLAVI